MIKRLPFLLIIFLVLFTFLPTSYSKGSVMEGYLTTTQQAPYQQSIYKNFTVDWLHAGTAADNDEINNALGSGAVDHVDYVWVDDNGEEIYARYSDTFPCRNGPKGATDGDYMIGTNGHTGTDLIPNRTDYTGSPQQVAVFGGEVVLSQYMASYGECVIIHVAENLYLRMAHMTRGSRKVSVGDVVQPGDIIGIMGGTDGYNDSLGHHAHLELILSDAPPALGNQGTYLYLGGIYNIIGLGKELTEISWYRMATYDRQSHTWASVVTTNTSFTMR